MGKSFMHDDTKMAVEMAFGREVDDGKGLATELVVLVGPMTGEDTDPSFPLRLPFKFPFPFKGIVFGIGVGVGDVAKVVPLNSSVDAMERMVRCWATVVNVQSRR
jgi:hypothetical protein